MGQAKWNDSLLTGNEQVDVQHRALLALINELQVAVAERRESSEIDRIVARLQVLAVEHFRDEEALMEHHAYPGLERQKELHAEFLRKAAELTDARAGDDSPRLRLLVYLHDWFVRHMKLEDSAIVRHIEARKRPSGGGAD